MRKQFDFHLRILRISYFMTEKIRLESDLLSNRKEVN